MSYKPISTFDFSDLRSICIKNNWFTKGSNEQYEKLFKLNDKGESVENLSFMIWIFSDADRDDVLNQMVSMKRKSDVQYCESYIIDLFDEHRTTGIYTEALFRIAKEDGMYNGGYGEPISDALENVCDVVTKNKENGDFLYNVFKLKEEFCY